MGNGRRSESFHPHAGTGPSLSQLDLRGRHSSLDEQTRDLPGTLEARRGRAAFGDDAQPGVGDTGSEASQPRLRFRRKDVVGESELEGSGGRRRERRKGFRRLAEQPYAMGRLGRRRRLRRSFGRRSPGIGHSRAGSAVAPPKPVEEIVEAASVGLRSRMLAGRRGFHLDRRRLVHHLFRDRRRWRRRRDGLAQKGVAQCPAGVARFLAIGDQTLDDATPLLDRIAETRTGRNRGEGGKRLGHAGTSGCRCRTARRWRLGSASAEQGEPQGRHGAPEARGAAGLRVAPHAGRCPSRGPAIGSRVAQV